MYIRINVTTYLKIDLSSFIVRYKIPDLFRLLFDSSWNDVQEYPDLESS